MNLNGVEQEYINRMSKQFDTSDAYKSALNYTQTLLDKVNSGKTNYTDQLNNLLSTYNNKQKFSYDMNSDTMFQNALSSAVGQGKNAMQDTIGQASALTGGYASSYATSAGNQQYNNYIKGAYDNLPAYYGMALMPTTQKMPGSLTKSDLLKNADTTEYGRTKDAYTANKDKTDTMYSQENKAWSDDVSQASSAASMQNTDWWNKTNYDFQQSEAQRAQSNADREYRLKSDTSSYQATIDELKAQLESKTAYYADLDKYADSKGVKQFEMSVLSNDEFSKRGKTSTVDGKQKKYDNYDQYLRDVAEKWHTNGTITDNEAIFLKYKYGWE